MNELRVNLLRKAEMRYQGAVSPRFVILSAVGTVAGVLVLLLSLAAMRGMLLREELKRGESRWNALQSEFSRIKKQELQLKESRELLEQFRKWDTGAFKWHLFFHEFQRTVPETVRLRSLALYIKNPAENRYELLLNGESHGERAESAVIEWRKNLLENPAVSCVLSAVDLMSLRREAAANGGTVRSFQLKAGGVPGRQPESNVKPELREARNGA